MFAQSNDHPRVNPHFYSKPTRYVYVNMCMTDDADISNPPQVGPSLTALPAAQVKANSPMVASNIVPAPGFLGKTARAQPAQAIAKAVQTGSAGVSWTTEDSASSDSILATADQIENSPYLHAFGPRDTTPYTPFALDIGGVSGTQHTAFQRSLLTAKERLRNLSKISLSSTDTFKTHKHGSTTTMSQSTTDLEDFHPFPASASMLGARQGSTRAMGSLEWLNMSSGPPKATSLLATGLFFSCSAFSFQLYWLFRNISFVRSDNSIPVAFSASFPYNIPPPPENLFLILYCQCGPVQKVRLLPASHLHTHFEAHMQAPLAHCLLVESPGICSDIKSTMTIALMYPLIPALVWPTTAWCDSMLNLTTMHHSLDR